MTIQQFQYIVSLDKHKHFVSAARDCGVTQPTLTMQLKKVEDELGFAIFDRSKKPFEITAGGIIVIERAKRILNEVKGLHNDLKLEDHMEGVFRLAIIPTLAPYLLPRFLKKFIIDYPNTELEITELQSEEIVRQLYDGKIDIGLLVTPLHETHLVETPVYEEDFLLYSRPDDPIRTKDRLEQEDLDPERIWLLSQGHCFRNQVISICNAHPQNRQVIYESGSIETLKRLVDNGVGYTLIPELSVEKVDQQRVRRFQEPVPAREVSLVTHDQFGKRKILDALHACITNSLPSKMKKKHLKKRIEWRQLTPHT